jgi:hypothetical protein
MAWIRKRLLHDDAPKNPPLTLDLRPDASERRVDDIRARLEAIEQELRRHVDCQPPQPHRRTGPS